MSNDEMKLITDLAEQLKAMSTLKDPEADAAIQQHIALIPEALYKLVQMVLIQHMAIDQLRAKISAADAQSVQTPPPPKGFLDDLKEKLFSSPAPSTISQRGAAQCSQAPVFTPATDSNQPASSGVVPSFLKQAMTVGAGVAGGMMLGNALGSLFQHGNSASLNQPNEIVENNYYEQGGNALAEQSTTDNYQEDTTDQDSDDDSFFDGNSSDSDWA